MRKPYALLAVLVLVALAVIAATPDYKAFRGSGAVTVTTNPPTGTVVIHVDPAAAAVYNSEQFDTSGSAIAIKKQAKTTNNLVYESLTTVDPGITASIQLKDGTETKSFKFIASESMLSNLFLYLPKAGSNGILTIASTEVDAENWQLNITPTSEIAWKSNLTVLAAGSIALSNQVIYLPKTNYNGSNLENPGEQVTNMLDLSTSILKPYTNAFTTDHTWLLTNIVPYASAVIRFQGNATTTNTFKILAASGGTNVNWHNWTTNGTHDINVRPTFRYAVYVEADGTGTNLSASVITDDSFQPFKVNTIYVPVGFTRSNAIVGGTIHTQIGGYTNLNRDLTTLTNLALWGVTGHTLTNNGDRLEYKAKGKLLAGTNRFTVVFGDITILDTGTITNLATDYEIEGSIVRTGQTNQYTFTSFRWGPGQGVYWPYTNNYLVTAGQTNGNANVDLSIKAGSRSDFGISNLFFGIEYRPAQRP